MMTLDRKTSALISRSIKKLSNNKGFTLLEVLISVTILAVIITPILSIFTTSFRITVISQELLDGTYVSQNVYENLVAQDYDTLLSTTAQKQLYDVDGDGTDDCYVQINLYPDGVYADLTPVDNPSYLHINFIGTQIVLFGNSGTSDLANSGTKTNSIGDVTLTNSSSSKTVTVQVAGNDAMTFEKKYFTSPLVIIANLQNKQLNSQDVTLTLSGDVSDVYVVEYARKSNYEELICDALLESNTYYGINDHSTTLIHANVQVFDINDINKRIGFVEGTFEVSLT